MPILDIDKVNIAVEPKSHTHTTKKHWHSRKDNVEWID